MTRQLSAEHTATALPGTAVKVDALAKSYGATVALRSVSFEIRAGEVYALLGENGAGKSTLVKILSGVVQPDAGRILLGANRFRPASLMEARAAGVSTAFQELSLLPNLSVAENLLLPHLVKGMAGLTSRRETRARAAEVLEAFDIGDIDPAAMVSRLSLAQKQRLEITRALSHRPRLLVLDEPTAALAEPEWLFDWVARLAVAGVAILYISHRLTEVRRLCRRGTVLRNGQSMGTVDLADTSDTEIFGLMVGRSPHEHQAVAGGRPAGASEPVLRVRGVRSGVPPMSVSICTRARFSALRGWRARGSDNCSVRWRASPRWAPAASSWAAAWCACAPRSRPCVPASVSCRRNAKPRASSSG